MNRRGFIGILTTAPFVRLKLILREIKFPLRLSIFRLTEDGPRVNLGNIRNKGQDEFFKNSLEFHKTGKWPGDKYDLW